ncbi:hypothetical protein D9Q98_006976 [Chlorella vulgaris]|uniref:Homoserine dehydrogenase n=1 Tax=Chlorella vulgaris TaxID=3077 RepID=A0A9D4TJ79_CHLVU|nr:hypothetical protein D9Q98_006976 [Chlorella vulgaris]
MDQEEEPTCRVCWGGPGDPKGCDHVRAVPPFSCLHSWQAEKMTILRDASRYEVCRELYQVPRPTLQALAEAGGIDTWKLRLVRCWAAAGAFDEQPVSAWAANMLAWSTLAATTLRIATATATWSFFLSDRGPKALRSLTADGKRLFELGHAADLVARLAAEVGPAAVAAMLARVCPAATPLWATYAAWLAPASLVARCGYATQANATALSFAEHGSPERVPWLQPTDLPTTLGDHEVRIHLLAAPINPSGIETIEGQYPIAPELPGVPVHEGVDEVEAVGSKVTRMRPGDRVVPIEHGQGTWRTHRVFNELHWYKISKAIPLGTAATMVINPPIAVKLLSGFVQLAEGDMLVQSGASSHVAGFCTFSEVVAEAKAAGYTEPDPRDDLAGMDVARKVTILAWECGMHAELADVPVRSLVPKPQQLLKSGAEYMERLPEFDGEMAALAEGAEAAGECLRYVGVVDVKNRQGSVELRRYAKDHPFA